MAIHRPMASLAFLAEIKVREEVAVERVEAIRILDRIEPIDSHNIPIVFYVRVAERDLRSDNINWFNWVNDLIDVSASHRQRLDEFVT
jgi:hypothetical protein